MQNIISITDMRDTFFEEIFNYCKKKNDLFIVSIDYGSPFLDKFRKRFKNQFINVGISEQAGVSYASGLAKQGFKVILYSINSFIIYRALEQIKLDLSYNNNPITILGVGPGYAYEVAGPTHHSTEDISVQLNIPNLRLFSPCDCNTIKYLSKKIIYSKKQHLNYIRLERGKTINYAINQMDINRGYREVIKGKKNIIFSYGNLVPVIYNYIQKLVLNFPKEKNNFHLVDLFELKKIYSKKILNILKNFENCFVYEEQNENGGISNILAKIILKNKININFNNFSIPDKSIYQNSTRTNIYKKLNFDYKSFEKNIIYY